MNKTNLLKEATATLKALFSSVAKLSLSQFEDADGNYWMAFGSWWTGIKLVRLDESTGKQSSSDKTVYSIANRGGSGIEGPSIIEYKGKYFLFTAWDVCCKMGAA